MERQEGMTPRDLADKVMAHSQDPDEWEDEAEEIESRPSGTQVVSARLPSSLAEQLLAVAAARGVKPSELVRDAVQSWLRQAAGVVVDINAFAGYNMQVFGPLKLSATQNVNEVVEVETDRRTIEVIEAVG